MSNLNKERAKEHSQSKRENFTMVGKLFQQNESSIAHQAELYRLEGEDLVTQARFSEAETSFRHSLEINPNSAAGQCSLGKVLKRRGEVAEAEARYRRA